MEFGVYSLVKSQEDRSTADHNLLRGIYEANNGILSSLVYSFNFQSAFVLGQKKRIPYFYAIARPSVCRLSVVCLSSVTFVRRTQAVQIFGNISTAFI